MNHRSVHVCFSHPTRFGSIAVPLLLLLGLFVSSARAPGHAPIPNREFPRQFSSNLGSTIKSSPLAVGAQSGISARIGEGQAVYHATTQEDVLQFRNPAQHLSAIFDEQGVHLTRGEYTWGLSLTAYGSGNALQPVAFTAPVADENRVEYRHPELTEWYVNGPLGLEQGFDLAGPPDPRQPDAPLTLVLTRSGDLDATIDPAGTSLTLSSDRSPILRYGSLYAYDADHRILTASLEMSASDASLLLHVDASHARYPILIDPLIEVARLSASDKTPSDYFGWSVAMDGDTIVVGTPYDDVGGFTDVGSAYVFVRPAAGWTGSLVESAKLTASGGLANDNFGKAVAISGDTIVVGAPSDDNTYVDSGSAYVFVRPPGGWSGNLNQTAKLTASDQSQSDGLGASVDIDGATIVAGAPSTGNSMSPPGAAYVFIRPVAGWSGALNQTAKLTASDRVVGDDFGLSVAMDGDTVVAGAPYADPGGISAAGAAYVFVKPVTGWPASLAESAKLTAFDKAPSDHNGWSVAISGDTVVSGAYRDDTTATDTGSVYVFVRPQAGWSGSLTESAKLTASDKASSDMLGYSVAVSGNTVVAGAVADDVGSVADAGSVYVFVKPAAGWSGSLTETANLAASDRAATDSLGASVAISADTIIGAAPWDDNVAGGDAGTAYLFPLILPSVNVSGSALTFPNQTVNTASVFQTVTVSNPSNVGLTISSITASGDFTQSNSCPAILASLAYCTIAVTFDPSTWGTRSGSLVIEDNASGGNIQAIGLSGTGIASGATLLSTAITFLGIPVGSTSSAPGISLINNGSAPLSIYNISISGDFTQMNNCPGALAASASCTITVSFTPTAVGTRSGTLMVYDDATIPPSLPTTKTTSSTSVQTVALTGTGLAAATDLSTYVLNFGNRQIGTTSPAQSVILTDSGNTALAISSITTSADYAQTNNCGASLAISASCAINVTFTPSAASVRLGTLTIVDSASGSPHIISLAGTGTTSPVVAPGHLTFGATVLGSTSAPQSAAVTNIGGAMLGITNVTAIGDFSQTNNCAGHTLPVGSSCTIDVTFRPDATGVRTGSVTIAYDSDSSPLIMSLTGTGQVNNLYLPFVKR